MYARYPNQLLAYPNVSYDNGLRHPCHSLNPPQKMPPSAYFWNMIFRRVCKTFANPQTNEHCIQLYSIVSLILFQLNTSIYFHEYMHSCHNIAHSYGSSFYEIPI